MTATLDEVGETASPTPATTDPEPVRSDLPGIPWRDIVRWALVGMLGVLALIAVDVSRYGGSNPVSLIQPGTKGPSAAVVAEDFPAVQPPAGLGLDGQQYYAIARSPMHLDQVAPSLDRPRYRLQRPLLPWLAWALHPTGGGTGLIWALLAVGLALVFAGAVATGVLSTTWGGKAWLAAVLPLLPGTYWSLRVTVADAPALALAVVAIALSVRRRPALAVLIAVLAVLAKEPVIIVFVGWGIGVLAHRRRNFRHGSYLDALGIENGIEAEGRSWWRAPWLAAFVIVPGLVAFLWMLWLRSALPGPEAGVSEVTLPPFGGLVHATSSLWLHGHELVGMASSVAALVLGVAALVVRRRHPLWWVIALLVAFAAVMSSNVIGMNFGGTRSNEALLLFAVVALATPAASWLGRIDLGARRAVPEPADA